ncbi:hypothetical protein [Puia sp.]|uniref:hypothetical protein n=1 Tax=Puia sp. TaxID=2045100 RepID=UPI002F3EB920
MTPSVRTRTASLSSVILLAITALVACHPNNNSTPATADTPAAKHAPLPTFKRNPETRTHVKKEPVAEYKIHTDNKLNELYFSVALYETPVTMNYLAKFDFEGLGGEDTIRLPDVGIPPHPVLQKGPEKYSCIIGLMDHTNNFRPLKKVYVTDKGSQLKITTLKHYTVTEGYRLVPQ